MRASAQSSAPIGPPFRPPIAPWPRPFARPEGHRLPRRWWALLVLLFLGLHYVALLASTATGNFDPLPNHDHVHVMRQVLDRGYPTIAVWPPGFGYYMAFKWELARVLGLPYWTGKLLVDPLPAVASGLLSVLLGLKLTGSRVLAVAVGVGLVAAPIFALASAEGLAVLLFQPLFVGALLLFVSGLERSGGARMLRLAASGALLGLACLVRANPQFLLLALASVAWWVDRRAGRRRPLSAAASGIAVALAAQVLVLLPWSLVQRAEAGRSGVFAAPVVYYAYFDGMRRHTGFEVSDALRADPTPPPLSAEGVVRFNREWLERDPAALAKLYAVKAVRTWYLSDSGRWDLWILALHAPWWLLAAAGLGRWLRRAPGDPALLLVLAVILYMWGVSAAVSGLARYMAPVYGLLGLLGGVGLLPLLESRRRSP